MMTTETLIERLPRDQRAREFFLARQPILDRHQDLVGYELLFRRAAVGPANVVNDLAATATVIEHAAALGLENVIGDALAFVNVDEAMLMADIVHFLPADRVVLEILETVESSDALIRRVAELAAMGYAFALDDVITHAEHLAGLLPYVALIKIDLTGVPGSEIAGLAGRFRAAGKALLAEKVETIEQFETCLALGFSYFQGFYFAQPNILSGNKLAPSQITLMHLVSLIGGGASSEHIERVIKQDASLGLMLLRLVNAAGAGGTDRITSLGQALTRLGRRQLQRWVQILLYAHPGKDRRVASPLLAVATTRGKLMELITEQLHPGRRVMADTAFTVGIMSLMDTLFAQPMATLLAQSVVPDDVRQALLARTGFLGDLLTLAESIERVDEHGDTAPQILRRLCMAPEELSSLQLEAFEWSNQLSGSARAQMR